MRNILATICTLAALGVGSTAAHATSIAVSPTTIDMTAPGTASQLTLKNAAKKPVNIQVRVFKWSQENGKERLEPTKAVVASPPSTRMAPGQEYVIRVVRVAKAPVKGEESYRVFVDELPQASEAAPNTINMVIRQSIPVFFSEQGVSAPKVAWSVTQSGGRTMLTARNSGSMRLKVSDMTLSQGGKAVARSNGLVGYVLGGSTMSFPVTGKAKGAVTVQADSNMGPFTANTR